ncbi:type II toxin-antitoxin system PemK/MazF family toxin [Robbsia andropogonis]|uniref:type II toxin-antitoxin system PemK/MazF family toxin n=1 Tax=Robbsia andropogonis TaxID=28092 RepID=UPI0022A90907|nr:type II toxin-antitoxin system PemK/MazF family toxin [Robbsia andropogonis]
MLRVTVQPSDASSLRMQSQIAVDKIFIVRREKIGMMIGQLEDDVLVAVNRSRLVFLGVV